MKVLIVATDLFYRVGGGETVYRKIIESTPEVEFTYFLDEEAADAPRPANAKAVPMCAYDLVRVSAPPPFPAFKTRALEQANRIARSIAGMSFDIVDLADYYSFGSMLRVALRHHHVDVKRIVLAMHGNVSTSHAMQWGCGQADIGEEKQLEEAQFASADAVYGISERYIGQWRARVDRPVQYVDPMNFVRRGGVAVQAAIAAQTKPSLYCIGRVEGVKGNDLFIELVRWLDARGFDRAKQIGNGVMLNDGRRSDEILRAVAGARGLTNYDIEPPCTCADLAKIYAARSMVIVPARQDTLNLVALEALFSGCPVAISSGAGVCDYLDRAFPELPYVKIDLTNFYACVEAIDKVLADYDAYRAKLTKALDLVANRLQPPQSMAAIYAHALGQDSTAVVASDQTTDYEEILSSRLTIRKMLRAMLPSPVVTKMRRARFAARRLGDAVNGRIGGYARLFRTVFQVATAGRKLSFVASLPERNEAEVADKLRCIYNLATTPLFRCNYWRELARLERMRGNDMIAAAYELRVMRLMGGDRFGLLPAVTATLKNKKFVYEAAMSSALYGRGETADATVTSLFTDSIKRNAEKNLTPLEHCIDKRQGTPRVAVIVSMYGAASKVNFFLGMLHQQRMIRRDPQSVEIILVDSGSPTNEREVIEAYWAKSPLNAVYARSAERETIQAAWNRGIQLAKAPYVVFLGVDEGVYPEAFDRLCGVLDSTPSVDWVMGSGHVTEVDPRGVFARDESDFDRRGASKELAYLDSCYLTYVGSMYRKSMHDRLGYYDEAFRGAGDTAFKGRVLPHIRVEFLPEPLGIFFNFPEARTTASPMAEIEDLRAWYAYRSPEGMRHQFAKTDNGFLYDLLIKSLAYRKSYCQHTSMDIEYAYNLACLLLERGSDHAILPDLAKDLKHILDMHRALEFMPVLSGMRQNLRLAVDAWLAFKAFKDKYAPLLPAARLTATSLLRDNRYEQHSWLWKSL